MISVSCIDGFVLEVMFDCTATVYDVEYLVFVVCLFGLFVGDYYWEFRRSDLFWK